MRNNINKKALIVFGTRPEAIKMAPVINKLNAKMEVVVCVTAQHRELLDQVLDLFEIIPDYDLDIMGPGQDLFEVTSNVLLGIKNILSRVSPDLVLVHGDTTTAMAASMAAFYNKTPIGHVEAGLRTDDIQSPFPEEFNRQLVTKLARYHFAPTKKAQQNLLNENVLEENIFITGNTIIDSLFSILEQSRSISFSEDFLNRMPFFNPEKKLPRIILVTGHRRENFGQGFEEICLALKSIALQNPKVEIIYPVHLNPNVQEPVRRLLLHTKNIHLIEPLDYQLFVKLMDLSYIILTDSGGIQEEAPSLGKPVILMRDSTERPEAVEAKTVKLVGSNKEKIIESVNFLLSNDSEYFKMSKAHNPYGDGEASRRIRQVLEGEFYAS